MFVFVLVGIQLAVAYFRVADRWIWVVLLAYALGAYINHALFVLNHESRAQPDPARARCPTTSSGSWAMSRSCSRVRSRSAAITCSTTRTKASTSSTPTSRAAEARLVGYSTWRKTVWLGCLGVMQALRPLRVKAANVRDQSGAANFVVIGAVDVALVLVWGPKVARLPGAVDVLRARPAPGRRALDPGALSRPSRARRPTRTTGRSTSMRSTSATTTSTTTSPASVEPPAAAHGRWRPRPTTRSRRTNRGPGCSAGSSPTPPSARTAASCAGRERGRLDASVG